MWVLARIGERRTYVTRAGCGCDATAGWSPPYGAGPMMSFMLAVAERNKGGGLRKSNPPYGLRLR